MRDFTIITAEQRSPEWHAARLGRLTGSVAGDMLAKRRDKTEAAGRRNLRLRLILERLTGKSQESTFQSDAMRQGIEREPRAIAAYEAETGLLFEQTGFLSHNELMVGCSLDAHLGDFEILVSIKCREAAAHWDFLRSGIIPADAIAQMRHEAWFCQETFREHHYVSWNPDFPEGKQRKTAIYTPKMLDLPEYEGEALRFLAEVDNELKSIDGWQAVAEGVA
jgi:hypothetical protein